MTCRMASMVGWVSSSIIAPSRRKMTRSAKEAARASWVTMTTVWSSLSTAVRRMRRTSVDELE